MSDIIIYKSDANKIEVSVQLDKDTVWLNLNQIATLFDRDKSVISRHLNNIFKSKELQEIQLLQKMQQLPQMVKPTN